VHLGLTRDGQPLDPTAVLDSTSRSAAATLASRGKAEES
jgi:hypothetical protein